MIEIINRYTGRPNACSRVTVNSPFDGPTPDFGRAVKIALTRLSADLSDHCQHRYRVTVTPQGATVHEGLTDGAEVPIGSFDHPTDTTTALYRFAFQGEVLPERLAFFVPTRCLKYSAIREAEGEADLVPARKPLP